MQVNVRGVNVKVVENVKDYAAEKVGHVARIFDGVMAAEVEFSEQRNPRVSEREVVEVTMTTTVGQLIRAGAHASDPFAAVDMVVDRLERQVRRLKEKLVGRSHPRNHHLGAVHSRRDKDDEADTLPRIVRTKRFDIKPMTAEEAALQMDLLGHDFYFFSNSETGECNVVYRRRDGDLGLIEPTS
jgi:putative sigma-54 modulation protein